jgi:bacillithiol biosynthesis cysteine-adding enzyme BshC
VPESNGSFLSRSAIDLRRFPWFRRLAADYAFAFDSLAPFYAGNPTAASAWRDAIARASAAPRRRDQLVDALRAQLERRRAPGTAIAAAERLRDPRAVAVITGQQAGLFGGPLYTLLKAITAIQLAARTTRDFGVPAVPVFWIDAEDHDWDEVASTVVLDAEPKPRTLSLSRPPGAGEVSVASVRLDSGVSALVEELQRALPPTEFTAEVLGLLANAYRPGEGMADAFGRWIEALLGPMGLVLYDCADPATKPLVADVFAREFEEPGRTFELAAQAGASLEALGYHAQVTPHPGGVALFHLDGGRHAVRLDGGNFIAGSRAYTAAEMRSLAQSAPEQFSPNVLLRPLVQDAMFPTVCYVGGPAELAYLGQLRGVYEHFGVPMPLVYPRATATLVDTAAARFLEKYDLPIESLQPQDEAGLNRLLEAQLPASVEQSLHEATDAVQARMAAVIAAVPLIDPTLEGAARSTLGKMDHDLRTLHAKIIHAAKKRDETLRRQYNRARVLAFPGGHPQERTLGFVYFMNRYGPSFVDLLARELPLDLGRHYLLTL